MLSKIKLPEESVSSLSGGRRRGVNCTALENAQRETGSKKIDQEAIQRYCKNEEAQDDE